MSEATNDQVTEKRPKRHWFKGEQTVALCGYVSRNVWYDPALGSDCEECARVAEPAVNRSGGISQVHCTYCWKLLEDALLQNHLREKHGVEVVHCKYCGQLYSREATVRHLRGAHDEAL